MGYMKLESYDWIDENTDQPDPKGSWDGYITGPDNPAGANLYWDDAIPMIEKSAFDELVGAYKDLHKFISQHLSQGVIKTERDDQGYDWGAPMYDGTLASFRDQLKDITHEK